MINAIEESEQKGQHLNVIRNVTKGGSMLIDEPKLDSLDVLARVQLFHEDDDE